MPCTQIKDIDGRETVANGSYHSQPWIDAQTKAEDIKTEHGDKKDTHRTRQAKLNELIHFSEPIGILLHGNLIGWHTRKHGVGPIGLCVVVRELVVKDFLRHSLKLADVILLERIAIKKR